MNQSNSLFSNYELEFQVSNFKIAKIEDFFATVDCDVLEKNHKVDSYTIMVVTEDMGRHSIGYKDFYYFKGTVLAIRKDQFNKFHINSGVKGYILFFKEEFLNRYLHEQEIAGTIQLFNELLTSPKTQFEPKDFDDILEIIKKIENEFFAVHDEYSLKIIRSQLHILITKIHRIKSKGLNKVQLSNYLNEFIKFQNLVEKKYKDSKKVKYYADKLGFSTKKLNTIINFVTGKNAKLFIDDVVIIKAKRDLLHSNLSIKEIAYKLGFKDPANFYKYYRKHTGFTPETYRKRYSA